MRCAQKTRQSQVSAPSLSVLVKYGAPVKGPVGLYDLYMLNDDKSWLGLFTTGRLTSRRELSYIPTSSWQRLTE